jgi:hypothetical protein
VRHKWPNFAVSETGKSAAGLDPGFEHVYAARVRVEARAGDAQDAAEPLDAEPVLVVLNELAAVHQRVAE